MKYIIENTEEILVPNHTNELNEVGETIESIANIRLLKTRVKYTFDGYGEHIVTISHFNPEDIKDIERGIENRAITEQKKLGLI
jgi:hypothetical protein